ncbi:MAG: hypothetical protein K6G91_08855 [Kiritimatiellae bacterium]|nr:hypothetical protein [Kiritimatiellia bacterium]
MGKTFSRLAVCAAAVLAAAAVRADMALAYHGKLVPVGGAAVSTKLPRAMEFRLYRNAEPGETMPLWGRYAPVRFSEDGSFYVELSDETGSPLQKSVAYEKIADAVGACGDGDVWISVTPFGYSELLPRKRLGGVHRAERAVVAKSASKAVAPKLMADTIVAGTATVAGNLVVSNSFVGSGATLENTITAPGVSLGVPGGTVVFTSTFSCWNNVDDVGDGNFKTHVGADMLFLGNGGTNLGFFSVPLQHGQNVPSLKDYYILTQQFLGSRYSPFF